MEKKEECNDRPAVATFYQSRLREPIEERDLFPQQHPPEGDLVNVGQGTCRRKERQDDVSQGDIQSVCLIPQVEWTFSTHAHIIDYITDMPLDQRNLVFGSPVCRRTRHSGIRHVPTGRPRKRNPPPERGSVQTSEESQSWPTDENEGYPIRQSSIDRLRFWAGKNDLKLTPPPGLPEPRDEDVERAIGVWYNTDNSDSGKNIIIQEHQLCTLCPNSYVGGNFILFYLKNLVKDDGVVLGFDFVPIFKSILEYEWSVEQSLPILSQWLYTNICFKDKKWLIVAMNGNEVRTGPGHLVVLLTDVQNEKCYFIDPAGQEHKYILRGWPRYLRLRKDILVAWCKALEITIEKFQNEFDGANLELQYIEHAVQSDNDSNCAIIGLMTVELLIKGKDPKVFKCDDHVDHVDYGRYYLTTQYLLYLRSIGID